jgi:cis-3-alkyl-4-acyloxetan-2-one decarboxylase
MASFRRDLYPFTRLYLNLDGISLHYLDEGKGDPILMLHGNPTWSFFYRNLILGLRGDHRAIAPDHIGCGLSDKPEDSRYEYTLERRVKDLEALIDHLKLDRPLTLVMHDWGGMIGMAYAVNHPERIGRLVLLNTAAFHLPKTKQLPPSLWVCRNTPLNDFLIRRSGLFCRLVTRWGCCTPMPEQVRDGYLLPHGKGENRLAHLRFVQDIPLQPGDRSYSLVSQVQERLPAFRRTPTLILWGEKDFVFDHHFLSVWQQILPEAEVHRFADAGHLVLEDKSGEILPIIRAFFEKHPI